MGGLSKAKGKTSAAAKSRDASKADAAVTAMTQADSVSAAGRQRWKIYGYAAATAAVMVVLMFISRSLYPFGDKVLRYTADGTQYFGILGYLQNTLFTDDNLLYAWGNILGGNMTGIYAYYAASPFNLLTFFFPDNLMAAYHFIFAVKFVAAAVCFAVMLVHLFPGTPVSTIVLFAAAYPFIGFTTYYAWNQSWMDGVIFLPLVLAGTWSIIQNRKPLLYIAALALALYSNYYIGYMICIASVLLFTCAMILVERRSDRKQTGRIILCWAVGTVTAAALAACLLLPTYAALPENRAKTLPEIFDGIRYLSKPNETISMLFTAPYENMEWKNNYPVIFTGVVQLVLIVLFFANRQISKRFKIVAACLFALFFLSFEFSPLNYVWHGFSDTMWFRFRYSFIVAFVIELIAFYSFTHVRGTGEKLTLAGAIVAVLTLIACRTDMENVGAGTLLLDIVWIIGFMALFYFYGRNTTPGSRTGRLCFALIAGIVLGNLLINAYQSLSPIGDGDTITAYEDATVVDREIEEAVNDDGFYRIGSTWRYGSCNPLRAGYAGVENFASPENAEAVDAVTRLGLRSREWRSWYGDNVPLATDALLGLRYIVTGNDHKSDQYEELARIPQAGLIVYRNPIALPVIFPAETTFSAEGQELNKFEYINNYWNAVSSAEGDIFSQVDYTAEVEGTDDGKDLRITFTPQTSGRVYAYIPKGDRTVDSPVEPKRDYQDVYYVGEYESGEQGELVLHLGNDYDQQGEILLYSEEPDVLTAKARAVLSDKIDIQKESSSHLTVKYTADEDSILASTIPYDEGWTVRVDGTEVPAYRNMDSFLTFDVAAGEHEIELIYWPPLLTAGIWITAAALSGVVLYILWTRRRQHGSEVGRTVQRRRSPRSPEGIAPMPFISPGQVDASPLPMSASWGRRVMSACGGWTGFAVLPSAPETPFAVPTQESVLTASESLGGTLDMHAECRAEETVAKAAGLLRCCNEAALRKDQVRFLAHTAERSEGRECAMRSASDRIGIAAPGRPIAHENISSAAARHVPSGKQLGHCAVLCRQRQPLNAAQV